MRLQRSLRSRSPLFWCACVISRKVRSPSWMDGSKTRVEESAVTVQGTAPVAVIDNKEFIFPEIAAYVCHTGHSTTGLASTTPPSFASTSFGRTWHGFCVLLLVSNSSVTQKPRQNYLHCWCHTFPLRCTCLVFPGSQGLECTKIGDHNLRNAFRLPRWARCDRTGEPSLFDVVFLL